MNGSRADSKHLRLSGRANNTIKEFAPGRLSTGVEESVDDAGDPSFEFNALRFLCREYTFSAVSAAHQSHITTIGRAAASLLRAIFVGSLVSCIS